MKPSSLIPMLLAVSVAMAACGPSGDGDPPAAVPSGSWGGKHVALQVDESGATVQFDCAHGRIPSVLALDADGRFEVAGVFVPESGGPIHEGDPEDARAAVYAGRLQGDELTFSVRLSEDGSEVGTFTARLRAPALLFRCV